MAKPKTANDSYLKFPYSGSEDRLNDYEYFEQLFMGKHWEAFSEKINNTRYNKDYNVLRYVMANFAGLVSKIVADLLFTEPPQITLENNQEWLDEFIHDNKLNIQNYESALSNSYFGDAVYKLRVGKRQKTSEKSTVIVEDISPRLYFPDLDSFNVRQDPDIKELAWKFTFNDRDYLRREVHLPEGNTVKIYNSVYLLENGKIAAQVEDISVFGITSPPVEDTKIKESCIIHIPNFKTGTRYFGISDYSDLTTLFYAINNRMTKIDAILDKHSDPILLVPEGVLDEKGQVQKEHMGVIEIKEGDDSKPEYVVWNASLESAFKQIDNLVETLFMISEISPDILGMGKGQAESGRALKLKLLRTIAKARRKRMYYDHALKQVIYNAQVLSQAWGVGVGSKNIKLVGEPELPEIEWQDGLPIDISEQLENEERALSMGITTEADSMMRVYGIDEESAEEKAQEIKDENKVELPTPNFTDQKPKEDE